jgi:3-oxoacyl-[acyl-carrier protein] reductase
MNTPMNKEISDEFKKQEEEKILLNRFAEPEEVANVIYFITSDEATYVNDSIIRVDGGKK